MAGDMHAATAIRPPSTDFLFTRFDRVSPSGVFDRAASARDDEPFRYIVTPNVDHVVRLNRERQALSGLYDAAWLSVCDSRIIELLADRSGLSLPATPGADLTEKLLNTTVRAGDTLTVIGGSPDVVAALRERFTVNWHDPPFGLRNKPDAIAACAQFIADHPARYTFIAVGSPQQEMVARAALKRGDCTGVGLCVGASLEFYTGHVERAPQWMRSTRMEWLHRLSSNPARLWRRYLVDGPEVFRIWMDWRRARGDADASPQ